MLISYQLLVFSYFTTEGLSDSFQHQVLKIPPNYQISRLTQGLNPLLVPLKKIILLVADE